MSTVDRFCSVGRGRALRRSRAHAVYISDFSRPLSPRSSRYGSPPSYRTFRIRRATHPLTASVKKEMCRETD